MKANLKYFLIALITLTSWKITYGQCSGPGNTGVDFETASIDPMVSPIYIGDITSIVIRICSNSANSLYIPTNNVVYNVSLPNQITFATPLNFRDITDPLNSPLTSWSLTETSLRTGQITNTSNFPDPTCYDLAFDVIGVSAGQTDFGIGGDFTLAGTSTCGDINNANDDKKGTIQVIQRLPINLIYFGATKKGNTSDLTWEYSGAENFSHFELEKSNNGKNFTKFENQLHTLGGSRNLVIKYSKLDISPYIGTNYYRLKIVDLDGSFKYSKIIKLRFDQKFSIQAFPNPFTDFITLQGLGKTDSKIEIINHFGQLVKELQVSGNQLEIQMKDLIPGIYQLRISKEDYYSETIKIVRL